MVVTVRITVLASDADHELAVLVIKIIIFYNVNQHLNLNNGAGMVFYTPIVIE